MQNVFKLFGEKDTGSFEEQFDRSRIALTCVYVAILAIILFSSGSITRALFSYRLEARFRPVLITETSSMREDRLVRTPDPNMVRRDLSGAILLVNSSLLLLAGVSSYWLAGMTLRPIKRAYQKQRQFLSDASHELRTPLAILQTNLENEQRTTKGEGEKLRLQSHLEEVERMGRLVNDLLVLSRLGEQGTSTHFPRHSNAKETIQKTFDRLASLASERKVSLFFEKNAPDLYVEMEEDMFLQTLTNVIKNAILYNKPEGTVTVGMTEGSGKAIVSVVDTGFGMSKEDTVHVFNRFYRADQSRSRETGGSGLGLSIAQAMIEKQNGTISLSSILGKGTTVTIILPIHTPS